MDWPIYTQQADVHNVGLREFIIPGINEKVWLRDGCAGFVLAHFAAWYARYIRVPEVVEGWAYHPLLMEDFPKAYASGTAIALLPKSGEDREFKVEEFTKVYKRLKMYQPVIKWGGRVDGDPYYYEIASSKIMANALAIRLESTPLGREILKVNTGLKTVIET